jgi:hypothetical protein
VWNNIHVACVIDIRRILVTLAMLSEYFNSELETLLADHFELLASFISYESDTLAILASIPKRRNEALQVMFTLLKKNANDSTISKDQINAFNNEIAIQLLRIKIAYEQEREDHDECEDAIEYENEMVSYWQSCIVSDDSTMHSWSTIKFLAAYALMKYYRPMLTEHGWQILRSFDEDKLDDYIGTAVETLFFDLEEVMTEIEDAIMQYDQTKSKQKKSRNKKRKNGES